MCFMVVAMINLFLLIYGMLHKFGQLPQNTNNVMCCIKCASYVNGAPEWNEAVTLAPLQEYSMIYSL